ncbi:MAG: helix-turn-helix transcriptional regulator [Gemmatimonadota bacterium]|nr:helix-turn-helix transcriptional regulator [Gemmatimonadota bacterium]
MKIDHGRLRSLRKSKRLTRQRLAEIAGIHPRTIQRLENDPDQCRKTREDTVNELAKALDVEPGVLTGELPLPALDEAPENESYRIGARVTSKVRLAYDLIKRRYGVNTNDLVNMAPFFFTLLAEGSLAHRRKELEEADSNWHQITSSHGVFGTAIALAEMNSVVEEESIRKNDIFGEHLLSDSYGMTANAFDPSEDNPFAGYLCKLATDLDNPDAVVVDGRELDFRLEFRFPYYGVCDDELDKIANGSPIGRAALEMGFLRTSKIPEELMTNEKDVERQKWLEESTLEKFNNINRGDLADLLKKFAPILVSQRTKSMLEENESGTSKPETEKKGDDQ